MKKGFLHLQKRLDKWTMSSGLIPPPTSANIKQNLSENKIIQNKRNEEKKEREERLNGGEIRLLFGARNFQQERVVPKRNFTH